MFVSRYSFLKNPDCNGRNQFQRATDGEEEEMQLTKVVPFLVEELLRLGAIYEKMATWQPFFRH